MREGGSDGSDIGTRGDGLTNRGVKRAPEISDSSQKTGRVVIYVCVDRMGNVTKADYTQRGSTTSDARLVSLAKQNAYRYLFSQSNLDEQCGTICPAAKSRPCIKAWPSVASSSLPCKTGSPRGATESL